MLYPPVVLLASASEPVAVLKLPVVFCSSAAVPLAVFYASPLVLVPERLQAAGGVVVARGVEFERICAAGGVVVARGVGEERLGAARGVGGACGG